MTIVLRPVTMDDAQMLLEWRNDPMTRSASHSEVEISLSDHLAWLAASLKSPCRRLLLAELAGEPVGTLRVDLADGIHELSWTVAPRARGHGVAKRMVMLLAMQEQGPIRAEVKVGNEASAKVAEAAGMTLAGTVDGVWHFQRPAVPR